MRKFMAIFSPFSLMLSVVNRTYVLFMVVLGLLVIGVVTRPSVAQPVVIQGSISGHDGAPTVQAHAGLHTAASYNQLLQLVRAEDDGRFQMTVDTTGVFALWLTGVNHHVVEKRVILQPGDTLDVNVRLRTYRYGDCSTLSTACEERRMSRSAPLEVIGDFNDFQFRDGTVEMKKQPDDTYHATVASPRDSLAYQVINAQATRQRSINGTMSDRFRYDRGGDYQSIIATPDDSVTIVFDPAAVVEDRSVDARFTVQNASSTMNLYLDFRRRIDRVFPDNPSRRQVDSVRLAWHRRVQREETLMEQHPVFFDVLAKTDSTYEYLKDVLYIEYARYFDRDLRALAVSDASRFFTALSEEVAPTSSAWVIEDADLLNVSMLADDGGAYLQTVADKHADEDVREKATAVIENPDNVERMTKRSEDYAERYTRRMPAQRFRYRRSVRPGSLLRDVTFADVQDSSTIYPAEVTRGRYTIVATWASWCESCKQMLRDLAPTYNRYRKEMSILTVAMNSSADRVQATLEEDPLPGKHTMLPNEETREHWSRQMELEERSARYVLLHPSGVVVHIWDDPTAREIAETLQILLDD